MGTNTPERAAEEAKACGTDSVRACNISRYATRPICSPLYLRDPKTWSAKTYLQVNGLLCLRREFGAPGAKFGMPDVASDVAWLTEIADLWPAIENPPHVTTLTHHYYFGGPATNPEVNIPNLLKPATMAKVQKTADTATAAANKMGVRVRMTEGNTAIAAASQGCPTFSLRHCGLVDYLLLLASNNYL